MRFEELWEILQEYRDERWYLISLFDVEVAQMDQPVSIGAVGLPVLQHDCLDYLDLVELQVLGVAEQLLGPI